MADSNTDFDLLYLLKRAEPLILLSTIPLAIAAFSVNEPSLSKVYLYSVASGTMFLVSFLSTLIHEFLNYCKETYSNSFLFKKIEPSILICIHFIDFAIYMYLIFGIFFLLLNISEFAIISNVNTSQDSLKTNPMNTSQDSLKTNPISIILSSTFILYIFVYTLKDLILKIYNKKYKTHNDLVNIIRSLGIFPITSLVLLGIISAFTNVTFWFKIFSNYVIPLFAIIVLISILIYAVSLLKSSPQYKRKKSKEFKIMIFSITLFCVIIFLLMVISLVLYIIANYFNISISDLLMILGNNLDNLWNGLRHYFDKATII